MKTKVAKRGMFLLFVGIFCVMSMQSVNAAIDYKYFGGSADVDYRVVSEPYKKTDTANWAVVKWTYSDQESHNMWFKVVNKDRDRMGSSKYTYLDQRGFSTSNTYQGSYYYLYAGRENWWDPWTYVSGTWAP